MAISVNPSTFVITIPQSDLTLDSGTLYTYNTDNFRLELKAWEDDEGGIIFLKTHLHNTEVTVAGTTYARSIEILSPYSITFEDGQYTVILQGSNNNIFDVASGILNQNQVQVIPTNSAGLIVTVSESSVTAEDVADAVWDENLNSHTVSGSAGSAQIYQHYSGKVCIDISNGGTGTVYPMGTEENPVNNISDALTIANSFEIKKFEVKGTLVLSSGDFTEYNFTGCSNLLNCIIVLAGATTTNSKFESITLTGTVLGNDIYCSKCMVSDLSNVDGIFFDSAFVNTITIAPSGEILGKAISMASEPTIVDFNNNPGNFAVGAESGQIRIVNASAAGTTVRYAAYGGTIQIDSTCVSGSAAFIGSGQILDESGPGFTVDSTGLIAIPTIARAVWDVALADYDEPEAAGTALMNVDYDGRLNINSNGYAGTLYPIGTSKYPVNNLDDALTIAHSRNINTIILENSITIEATHDISNLAIQTIGIMGTTITFTDGCSANNSAFRYANLEGVLNGNDILLVESCSILNLENFSGIMQGVAFLQGSEISIGSWAELYNCRAGGDPGNEPEISIGDSVLSIQQYRGNLKLKDKTGSNRTVASFLPGNVIIDSTCVSGSIQILGVGEVEADNSGDNCHVDLDAVISRSSISESVWDEELVKHLNDKTTGHALMHESYDNTIFVDPINGTNGSTYPHGIRQHPVKNITDILAVANNYILSKIYVLGSLNVNGGEDVSGFTFMSDRSLGNVVVVSAGAITNETYFENLTVSGTMSGAVRYTTCVMGNINNFDGGAKNSLITGNINITGNGANYLTDCDTYVTDTTYKQINVGDNLLNIIRCRGNYEITNYTGSSVVTTDLVAGHMKIASSCVSGIITVAGMVRLIDESGAGCYVIDASLTETGISNEVLSKTVSGSIIGSLGYVINEINNDLKRALGLIHENIYIDNPSYDSDNNLVGARVRIYSIAGSVGTTNDIIGTYQITSTGSGPGKFTNWYQIKQ